MRLVEVETGNDLITLIESGQTASFTEFYTKYFQKLLLACNQYLTDIHVAEELVQDVFLKLWENPYQLAEVKSINAYLYRAVINSSINYINRQKNIEQHHIKIAAEFSDDYFMELDEEHEIIILLRKEIEKLPAQCKKVFKLNRFENLKYKEIAVQLNISEKTVENHIGNALKTLRERFLNNETLNKHGRSYLMLLSTFLY